MFNRLVFNRLGLICLLFVFFISACAPGVKGTSAFRALDLDYDNVVLSAGSTWYVTSSRSPAFFGMRLDGLTKTQLQNARLGKKFKDRVSNDFSITQLGLPNNWGFQLDSAIAVQEVTDVDEKGYSKSVYWSERIDFIFAISVPLGTPAGNYSGMATVESRSGKFTIIPISVDVQEGTTDAVVSVVPVKESKILF